MSPVLADIVMENLEEKVVSRGETNMTDNRLIDFVHEPCYENS